MASSARVGPDVVERGGDHRAPPVGCDWRPGWRTTRVCGDAGIGDVGDAERRERVDDRVDDRRRGADRAGLADALDAERVGRARGDGAAES